MNYLSLFKDYIPTITTLSRLQVTVGSGLNHTILNQSASVLAQLRSATPIDTGQMVQGWRQHKYGFMAIEIYNEVNRKGFSYPSAQITGTGSRGQTVAGHTGSFNRSWAGMSPNSKLRSVWVNQTNRPFVVGKLY